MKTLLTGSILLLSIAVVPSVFAKATLPNDDGNGHVVYLDRHNLNCGTKAIQSFRLYRPTKETIGYSYRCGSKSMGKQTHKETRANEDGKGNFIYLDRHKVNCGNYALQSFRLIRPTKSTMAYVYKCGTKHLNRVTNHTTKGTYDGKGHVVYLDRQKSINCGSRSLTAFRLFRPTKTTVAYKFSCGS